MKSSIMNLAAVLKMNTNKVFPKHTINNFITNLKTNQANKTVPNRNNKVPKVLVVKNVLN